MNMLPKIGRKDEGAIPRSPRSSRRPQASMRRADARPQFFREVVSELRKVTWPTREQTTHLTTLVIVVSLAIGIVLGAADWVFLQVVDRILLGR